MRTFRSTCRSSAALVAAAAVALALVVALPRAGAEAAGCLPAGGDDRPFTTSQAVRDEGAEVAVNGGGWGHGLGMSQYGAKGAALLGCNHEQILTTYFPGTALADTQPVSEVRVGLVQKYGFGELTAESGPVTWRLVKCVGDETCAGQPELPRQPKGAIWRITSKPDGTFVITQRNGFPEPKVIWEGGDLESLLRAQHEGTIVKVVIQEAGGLTTRRVRYGTTEFDSYAAEGGRIYAVQRIPAGPDGAGGTAGAMERYLWGLAEVPTSWPYETLKAQAVAGRSYALKRVRDVGIRPACRCHLYATTSDQYYLGYTQEENDQRYSGGQWKKAVTASADRILTYEGRIADTFYSSSHGGSSDEVDHVWFASIPYVTTVDTSRWETAEGVNNPYQRWSVGFTWRELAARFGLARVEKIEVVTYSPGGRPTRKDLNGDGDPDGLRVSGFDAAGNPRTVWRSGEQVRSSATGLGLRSARLRIEILHAPPPATSPSPSPSPSPTEDTESSRSGPTTDFACPQDEVPEADFPDVPEGHFHRFTIDCAVWWEVAQGKRDGTYDPGGLVRRDQMAAFIARTLEAAGATLPAEPEDHFGDDDGTTHELAINQLAELRLVDGTDAEARTYSPGAPVNRAQMATFLVRAYEHVRGEELPEGGDHFGDDEQNRHEPNINKARTAWIATGTSDTTYEPGAEVSRGQMATFLARLLDAVTAEGFAAPPSQQEETAPSPSPSPSPS